MVLDDAQRWRIEFICQRCGSEFAVWSAERDAFTQELARSLREAASRPGEPVVSGTISDSELLRRPPPAPRPRPPPKPRAEPRPPGSAPSAALPYASFARGDDLERRTPGALFTATHDWDGSTPNHNTHLLYLSASGFSVRRIERTGSGLVQQTRGPLPADEVRAELSRLAELKPQSFRRRLGFVRNSCDLDRTHTHVLHFFDGARLHTTHLVFGTERGLGVSYGDIPPRDDERAAFERMAELMRRT